MRTTRALLATAILCASLSSAAMAQGTNVGSRAGDIPVGQKLSPPGQVSVVTVNAKQSRVLDVERFTRLYELARSLRSRPPAFDGGYEGGVLVPDVIVIQEMRASNAEIFQRLMRQNFSYRYTLLGDPESAAKFMVNEDTVELVGEAVVWSDVCTDEDNPTDGWTKRDYQFGRFIEKGTGAPFVVAGIELARSYVNTKRCVRENVAELRRQLSGETAPVVVGGDFNRRPVEVAHECDPNEASAPQEWWLTLTSPDDDGTAFADAVQSWHRARSVSLADEWTQETAKPAPTCDGGRRIRRVRIDYLFSTGTDIAEAHADHPGWAGVRPGTRNPDIPRYSDHRFVWGRFVISGPARPQRPSTSEGAGGLVDLTWQPPPLDNDEAIQALHLYRSVGRRGYELRAALDPSATSFQDYDTRHGTTYRYALAAVGVDGGQSVESRPAWATADKRGPRVTGVRPAPGTRNVDRRVTLRAYFDERIDLSSVRSGTFRLYTKSGRRIGARTTSFRRVLVLDPTKPLRNNRSFRAVVYPVTDPLGNRGERYSWTFST